MENVRTLMSVIDEARELLNGEKVVIERDLAFGFGYLVISGTNLVIEVDDFWGEFQSNRTDYRVIETSKEIWDEHYRIISGDWEAYPV